MPRYRSDKELEVVAKPIQDAYHPNLKIVKIAFLFREEAAISDGRVVAGMAVKVDDRNWALHRVDAIVEIARDVWEEANEQFRNALIDHELSHIGIRFDESGTPVMDEMTNRVKVYVKHHDVEEFEAVLVRHGAYHKELRSFLQAFVARKEEQKKAKKAGMTAGTESDV